jgi:hypothetical protein
MKKHSKCSIITNSSSVIYSYVEDYTADRLEEFLAKLINRTGNKEITKDNINEYFKIYVKFADDGDEKESIQRSKWRMV